MAIPGQSTGREEESRALALKKRDPFKDLLFLQERMSRIFDETLLKYRSAEGSHWYPPVDIYETEESIVLKAKLQGRRTEDNSAQGSCGDNRRHKGQGSIIISVKGLYGRERKGRGQG